MQEDDEAAGHRLDQIYERLEELEADTAESRAAKILFGLGFSSEMMNRPTGSFSGGWRMRIALAQALFMNIVPPALRAKALAVLAATARDTEYIRTSVGGGYTCTDCGGGPGAHVTAGLFGIKWFLMALASDYNFVYIHIHIFKWMHLNI